MDWTSVLDYAVDLDRARDTGHAAAGPRPASQDSVRSNDYQLAALRRLFGSPPPSAASAGWCQRTARGNLVAFGGLRLGRGEYPVSVRSIGALPRDMTAFTRMRIVTGLDLFTGSSPRLRTAAGTTRPITAPVTEPATDLILDDRLGLLEWEAAFRLAAFTADLARAAPSSVPVSVTVELPALRHHLLVLSALDTGLVSPALAARWSAAVERRERQLILVLLSLLGFHLPGRAVEVEVRGVAPRIRRHLHARLLHGSSAEVGRLRQLLGVDPVWGHLDSVVQPATYQSVSELSGIVRVVRSALQATEIGPVLTVAVDELGGRGSYLPMLEAMAALHAEGGRADPIVCVFPAASLVTAPPLVGPADDRAALGDRFLCGAQVFTAHELAQEVALGHGWLPWRSPGATSQGCQQLGTSTVGCTT